MGEGGKSSLDSRERRRGEKIGACGSSFLGRQFLDGLVGNRLSTVDGEQEIKGDGLPRAYANLSIQD